MGRLQILTKRRLFYRPVALSTAKAPPYVFSAMESRQG